MTWFGQCNICLPHLKAKLGVTFAGRERGIAFPEWKSGYAMNLLIFRGLHEQAKRKLSRKDHVKRQEQWSSLHFHGLSGWECSRLLWVKQTLEKAPRFESHSWSPVKADYKSRETEKRAGTFDGGEKKEKVNKRIRASESPTSGIVRWKAAPQGSQRLAFVSGRAAFDVCQAECIHIWPFLCP